MHLIKLPQGNWARRSDIALIEPLAKPATEKEKLNGGVDRSQLTVVVVCGTLVAKEYTAQYPDAEGAYKAADALAKELNQPGL